MCHPGRRRRRGEPLSARGESYRHHDRARRYGGRPTRATDPRRRGSGPHNRTPGSPRAPRGHHRQLRRLHAGRPRPTSRAPRDHARRILSRHRTRRPASPSGRGVAHGRLLVLDRAGRLHLQAASAGEFDPATTRPAPAGSPSPRPLALRSPGEPSILLSNPAELLAVLTGTRPRRRARATRARILVVLTRPRGATEARLAAHATGDPAGGEAPARASAADLPRFMTDVQGDMYVAAGGSRREAPAPPSRAVGRPRTR